MKWSFPHAMYAGILCNMASFKGHCALGFGKAAGVVGENGKRENNGIWQFGRITKLSDRRHPEAAAGDGN